MRYPPHLDLTGIAAEYCLGISVIHWGVHFHSLSILLFQCSPYRSYTEGFLKQKLEILGALLTHLLRAWLSWISHLMEEPIALIIALRAFFQNTYQPSSWTQSAQITKYIKSAPIPYICMRLYHLHSWILTHSSGRKFTYSILNCSSRRRQWQPTPVLLPGKSHGQRSLVGCSPWGREESDTTERLPFHFSVSCIGAGNGNPLHCSCLENPRDRGAWWVAVSGVTQSRTQLKRLSSDSSSKLLQYLSPSLVQILAKIRAFSY